MERKRSKIHRLPNENGIIWSDVGPYDNQLALVTKETERLLNFLNMSDRPKHHLYITTDDEIKSGDWCIVLDSNPFIKQATADDIGFEDIKKIIATTDPKLIVFTKLQSDLGDVNMQKAQRLPQPSKAFIEKFCKVGGIDEVDVEYDNYEHHHDVEDDWRPKVDSHNEITIHPIKDSWTREEVVSLLQNMGGNAMLPPEEVDQWIKENL